MAAAAVVATPAASPLRSRRRMMTALVVVLVTLAAVALVRTDAGTANAPKLRSAASTFSIDDVRRPGTPVSLEVGGRPVVLNFFASWCAPCREELPVLEQAHRRSGGEVAFVGVDVADSRTRATELLDRAGITFPAGYDPDRSVANRYRLRGMPTTVFIDAAGRVAEVAQGSLTAGELDFRLARLLAPAGAGGVGTRAADATG